MAKTNFKNSEILYAEQLNSLGQDINANASSIRQHETKINNNKDEIANIKKTTDKIKFTDGGVIINDLAFEEDVYATDSDICDLFDEYKS